MTYEERAAAWSRARDTETRRSVLISRMRLATVLPGAAALLYALASGGPAPVLVTGAALILAFAGLVVWHARVDARAAWYEALRTVNRHGVARTARDWDALPPAEPPAGIDLAHHPYAADLDLFGRASLLQWLGPAATPAGAAVLHRWLLQPSAPEDVSARQQAVAVLAAAADWREALAAHGRLLAGVRHAELETFLGWCESAGQPTVPRTLQPATVMLTAAIWALIAAHAAGMTQAAYWLLPVLAGVILSFLTAGRVHGEFNRAGAGEHAFARYGALLQHAVRAPDGAAYLQTLRGRLEVSGHRAPESLRRLERIVGFANLRAGAGIFHFVVQALTLWDLHVYFALARWRAGVGPHVRGWMNTLGRLDALSTFARIRHDNPAWCLPEETAAETVFAATALGHPLIPDDRRVCNDVTVGPPGTLLLITGSNMSGKSTLLRAIGLNVVLAQAGAPVCAASLRLPPVALETSLRVQDSLAEGLSYFMAALARLKGVVDRADAHRGPGSRRVMYLLDEILQGTNTAERTIAVRAVARHLLEAGAIGVMTTHDLGLAGEEPLSTAASLAHFTETLDASGGMSFDYRLRPGLATSRNALRLMRLIGLPLE